MNKQVQNNGQAQQPQNAGIVNNPEALVRQIVNDGLRMAEDAQTSGYQKQSYIVSHTDEQRADIKARVDAFLKEEAVDVENPVDEPEFVLEAKGVGILPKGELHVIMGEKKAGKSTTYQIFTSALLGPIGKWGPISRRLDKPRIVVFDMEQSRYYAHKATKRMLSMAGLPVDKNIPELCYVPLRLYDKEGRLQFIRDYLEAYRPDVAIIDGLVDLVTDFNSIDESKPVIEELLALATHYNCCINCVIHTSKSMRDEARGHLGAFAVEKGFTIIMVSKDEKTGIFTVETDCCRGEDMPEWHFRHDGDDVVPADEEHEQNAKATKEEQAKKRAEEQAKKRDQKKQQVLYAISQHDGQWKRVDVVNAFEGQEDMGSSTVYGLIKELIEQDHMLYDDNGILTTNQQTELFTQPEAKQ